MNWSTVAALIKRWRSWIVFTAIVAGIGLAFFVGSIFSFRSVVRDAEKGSEMAQMMAARNYVSKEKYQQAVYWYEQAAANGNISAMYELATLLSRLDLPGIHDDSRAVELMRKAALNHKVDAQISLSGFYRIGDVVELDYAQAYLWADIARYNQASRPDGGDVAAHLIMTSISITWSRRHLTPEQIASVHRESLEWRQGFPHLYDQRATPDDEHTTDGSARTQDE